LLDNTGALDDLREVFRLAVHDRNLKIVDLDENIVDTQSSQRRQQMLDSGEHHTGSHQGRGVAAVRNRLNSRRDLKAAEIGATKNVSRVRRSRNEPDLNRHGRVQSYPVSFDRTAESGLFDQMWEPLWTSNLIIRKPGSNQRAGQKSKFRAIRVWQVGHIEKVSADLPPQFFMEIIIKNLNTLNCWSTLRPN
jgi:hypothetical protein